VIERLGCGSFERSDLWEISGDRNCSMILTSQLPVSRWHEQIGDPTLADGILDRPTVGVPIPSPYR
jgi:hypothetical protein